MRIKNTTTISNDLIREIINFVRPSGISNFDVMVKNGVGLAGRAYREGSPYHATKDPFIVCRVPREMGIRKTYLQMGAVVIKENMANYPQILHTYQIGFLKGRRYYLADRVECLVYIMAHELRHLWQHKAKTKRGYNWGSRGRFSEIDTESYAIRMLRAWRRRGNVQTQELKLAA